MEKLKNKGKYEIKEDISTINGEKRYCVLRLDDEIQGYPVYYQLTAGTKEHCEEYMKNLQREVK